ncbi:hypothetical protein KAI65_01705 [Candidatus Parcubacteria bacterium]|nr:hypothetical protein [Candidatus Parcubacteria bacterium]
MEINDKYKKIFTLKQKVFLYFYKSKQYLNNKWYIVKGKIKRFIDSFYFYFIFFGVFVFFLHKILIYLNLTISDDNLYGFAFATAGIIGASIAIIFSFSTFILQSTADLFSTQYLNKFIESTKEKIIFWLLVLFTVLSFLIPFFLKQYVLEILVGFLFISFYLIYVLYKESRRRINPETTLTKIKTDAIRQLEKINKELKKYAYIQNKILNIKKRVKIFL